MAQAIYREWFVHFRYPGHEDDELVDSPLGPIPDGWRVGAARESVIELRYGKATHSVNPAVGKVNIRVLNSA